MVKQFSLTKLMIALAIALQVSAVFAYRVSENLKRFKKDFADLYSPYEKNSKCYNSVDCGKAFLYLIESHSDLIDGYRLQQDITIDEQKKRSIMQLENRLRNRQKHSIIPRCSRANKELAIKTYKETPLENKKPSSYVHFCSQINHRIECLIYTAEIEKLKTRIEKEELKKENTSNNLTTEE